MRERNSRSGSSGALRQGFGLSHEPYDASIEDPEAEMTRAWRHHEGRVPTKLWAEEQQEPTVTTSIKPFEIEEVREQLRQEQEQQVAAVRASHVKTVRIAAAADESEARSRHRALVTWLTPIAVLTFVCAVAYHLGYRAPRIDIDAARSAVSQVDFRPLWSTLERAKDVLRVEQDRLFARGAESVRAPSPQLAPASPPVSDPVPIVEQLQVVEEEQVDVALPSSLGPSSAPEDALPAMEPPSNAEEIADERATVSVDTSSEPVVRPQAKRGARELRGQGTLRINSLPWAEIYVDGELLGHTPEMRLELPAGTHEVTLKNPEQNLLNTFVVRIRPGRVVTRIVDLREEPNPSAP